jgi:hypothetical protein
VLLVQGVEAAAGVYDVDAEVEGVYDDGVYDDVVEVVVFIGLVAVPLIFSCVRPYAAMPSIPPIAK